MMPSQEICSRSFWGLFTICVTAKGIFTAVYSVSVVATEYDGSVSGQVFELLQVPVQASPLRQMLVLFLHWESPEW